MTSASTPSTCTSATASWTTGWRGSRRRSRLAAIAGHLLDAGCPIREVNTGGGLGVPQAPGERPLDLEA